MKVNYIKVSFNALNALQTQTKRRRDNHKQIIHGQRWLRLYDLNWLRIAEDCSSLVLRGGLLLLSFRIDLSLVTGFCGLFLSYWLQIFYLRPWLLLFWLIGLQLQDLQLDTTFEINPACILCFCFCWFFLSFLDHKLKELSLVAIERASISLVVSWRFLFTDQRVCNAEKFNIE